MKTRGHGYHVGMWFSRLILKLLVYIHGIVHIAYACDLL